MKKAGLGVLGTVFVDMIGFGIVLPLLPFYADDLGASPLEVTSIIASFSVVQLIAAPIWGRMSDRVGRRRLLLIGLFASALSYLLFALADSIALLLISRAAAGAAGGTVSVVQAYVADSTEGEERARAFGLVGAASGLGITMGPVIGGYFSRFGLGVPGYVAAGLCLLNAIVALAFLPESRHFTSGRSRQGKGEAATLKRWMKSLARFPLRLLLVVYLLTIGCFTSMTSVLALYTQRVFAMTAADMGWIFTLAGGVTVLVRTGVVGRVVRRFGEPAIVRAGCVLMVVGVGAVPLVSDRLFLWFLVPVWAAATGLLFPSLHALMSRATDVHSQGAVLGGSQLAGGLGRVLGPLCAGALFQSYSVESPFIVGAAASTVAVIMAFWIPAPSADGGEDRIEPADRWQGPVVAHEPRGVTEAAKR